MTHPTGTLTTLFTEGPLIQGQMTWQAHTVVGVTRDTVTVLEDSGGTCDLFRPNLDQFGQACHVPTREWYFTAAGRARLCAERRVAHHPERSWLEGRMANLGPVEVSR